MLSRHLLAWLVLLSALAYVWPDWLPVTWDPFVGSKPYLSWIIAAAMFAVGWMLSRDEVREVLRRWPAVLAGVALQYLSMPALAWFFSHIAGLDPTLTIGVMVVGCVPGAMASNVLTLVAGGNASYSVSLTTLATLLSPLAVPAALAVSLASSAHASIPFWETSVNLVLMVVAPVLTGRLASMCLARYERIGGLIARTVAQAAILWVIAVVVGLNRDSMTDWNGRLMAVLLAINMAGFAAGYGGAAALRMSEGMRRALTLEIGMQNAGLGATLAVTLFPGEPRIALPAAMYTFGCMFTGAMLAQWWSRRPIE